MAISVNWGVLCGCPYNKGATISGHVGAPYFWKLAHGAEPLVAWKFSNIQGPGYRPQIIRVPILIIPTNRTPNFRKLPFMVAMPAPVFSAWLLVFVPRLP